MARRTKVLSIDDADSRDNGKSYLITEMSAESAEWWAFRVMQALLGSDAEIDFNAPLADVARKGLQAISMMDPEKAKPLLEEMMGCVQIQLPNGSASRALLSGDVEEVKTRIALRKSVLELHTGFFMHGGE